MAHTYHLECLCPHCPHTGHRVDPLALWSPSSAKLPFATRIPDGRPHAPSPSHFCCCVYLQAVNISWTSPASFGASSVPSTMPLAPSYMGLSDHLSSDHIFPSWMPTEHSPRPTLQRGLKGQDNTCPQLTSALNSFSSLLLSPPSSRPPDSSSPVPSLPFEASELPQQRFPLLSTFHPWHSGTCLIVQSSVRALCTEAAHGTSHMHAASTPGPENHQPSRGTWGRAE